MDIQITAELNGNSIVIVPFQDKRILNNAAQELLGDVDINKSCYVCNGRIYMVGNIMNDKHYLIAVDLGGCHQEDIRKIYGELIRIIDCEYYENVVVFIPSIEGISTDDSLKAIVEGIDLGSYSFNKYKSKDKHRDCKVLLYPDDQELHEELTRALDRTLCITDNIKFARDLVNEPGNKLNPKTFVDKILQCTKNTNIQAEILDVEEMENRNIAGILAVGRGSECKPRLALLKYQKGSSASTIALIGKGVTTDLGGISLKIGRNLSPARTDLAGAAAVLAAINIADQLDIDVNIYGIIPLVENICDGNALKPGEIIRYNNGITVEIQNTDAEGRLVLADGILMGKELDADIIIDVATLTGSCTRALGSKIAGVLGNDALVQDIIDCGQECGEHFWQLPLYQGYRYALESDIADISNISLEEPGVITAGLFLKEFAGDANWAHIDIAGTRNSSKTQGYIIKGGTGFGVKTLVRLIEKLAKQNQ